MEKSKSKVIFPIVLSFSILIGCLIFWYAIEAVIIAFAAILLAILLNFISVNISRFIHLPHTLVLTCVIIVLVGVFALISWLAAPLIVEQLKSLFDRLPEAYSTFETKILSHLDIQGIGMEKLTNAVFNLNIFNQATMLFSATFGSLSSIFIFLITGMYLAYGSETYINGFTKIFPPKKRDEVSATLFYLGGSLRWWLLGKLISMSLVGIFTMIGLWLLHVPLAFILALLAGLLNFIPYIGPILASIPGILIALAVDPWLALYVTIMYLVINTIEGYFVTPYIDQKTVLIPPALTIMTQVLLAILIGFLGLAFASPFMVVVLALMRNVYDKKPIVSEG